MAQTSSLGGKKVTILGDSYSTYAGYVPDGNELYYPTDGIPDVRSVKDTWWHLLLKRTGMRLLINDSFSGATVCTSVRPEHTVADAFVSRMKRCLSRDGVGGETPDAALLFGGTNDSWTEAPLGELQYEGWTNGDLKKALPAFCYMLHYVTEQNPQALVFAIVNTDMHPDYVRGILAACDHYDIRIIQLHDIDKLWGHPNRSGMRQIADQVQEAIEKAFAEA